MIPRNDNHATPFDYPTEILSDELEEIVARRVQEIIWDARNEIVVIIISEILSQKNAALTAAAIAYAAGMPILGGASQVEIAKKFGVTKQAFSRRVTEISKRLALDPSRGMRSEESRKTFKEKQLCRTKSQLQRAIQSLK